MEPADELQAIRDGVAAICRGFDDTYWADCDRQAAFPWAFHSAMAEGGWLGVTIPEQYGGAGLGVEAAATVMHQAARHSGAMAAASSIHINMFGPHALVVHGSQKQKSEWLPRLVSGEDQVCFAVTEPDAGLDTSNIETTAKRTEGGYVVNGRKIWTSTAQIASKIIILARTSAREDCAKPTDGMSLFYADLDRAKVDVQPIEKHGRHAVDSNLVFFDNVFVPEAQLIGDGGCGFHYLLDSLNPERILIAAEAIAIGQDALDRAARYAREREVFGRPIGQNQAIQHPLAECWASLEAAWLMAQKAARLYDAGASCGAQANAAKLLGGRAGHAACQQALLTHGGMGYAKDYQIERLLREVLICRLAPVSEQLILSFIAEKALHQPKSY